MSEEKEADVTTPNGPEESKGWKFFQRFEDAAGALQRFATAWGELSTDALWAGAGAAFGLIAGLAIMAWLGRPLLSGFAVTFIPALGVGSGAGSVIWGRGNAGVATLGAAAFGALAGLLIVKLLVAVVLLQPPEAFMILVFSGVASGAVGHHWGLSLHSRRRLLELEITEKQLAADHLAAIQASRTARLP